MPQSLVITVRLYDGRFHGAGEWCPSPARLFQALVAAAGRGGIPEGDRRALEWLEQLPPPIIGSPELRRGEPVELYVPNNDLDAVGGDLARMPEIRVAKSVEPLLFNRDVPFIFAWELPASEDVAFAGAICNLARCLYQFGRGVDPAYGDGELVEAVELERRLDRYSGNVLRPRGPAVRDGLRCPEPGTLDSLEAHFRGALARLRQSESDPSRQLLIQPPRARFASIAYDGGAPRKLFDLLAEGGDTSSCPLREASVLVVALRDAAAARLRNSIPDRASDIEAFLIGRKANREDAAPAGTRVRVVPLPSIGHPEADRRIRRILVEVPLDCGLLREDVFWAFSGVEHRGVRLVPSWSESMLDHYGFRGDPGAKTWRTVTAAALPASAARRRVEPSRAREEAKPGSERAAEERRAISAVYDALRHAGVRTPVARVRVQREPFDRRGERAEAFAAGTRFPKERLWHVELQFSAGIGAPLVIGDGRYLGLGLMAPRREETPGAIAFVVESGLIERPAPDGLARAFRRAVMARVQQKLGHRAELSTFFSGHDRRGEPASSPHLAFHFDPPRRRLLVIAPHLFERRAPTHNERRNLDLLGTALVGFDDLRAGGAGRLRLRPVAIDFDDDPLFAPAHRWETVTRYAVTRHLKKSTAIETAISDLSRQCRQYTMPVPEVATRDARGESGRGLTADATLIFKIAVPGPIILGRTHHLGGGLFAGLSGKDEQR